MSEREEMRSKLIPLDPPEAVDEERRRNHARLLWVRYVASGDVDLLGNFFQESGGQLEHDQSTFLICVLAGMVKFKGRPSEEINRMNFSLNMRRLAAHVGAKSVSDFLRHFHDLDLKKTTHLAEHKRLNNMVSDGKNPWKQTVAAARRNYEKVLLDPELVSLDLEKLSGLIPAI